MRIYNAYACSFTLYLYMHLSPFFHKLKNLHSKIFSILFFSFGIFYSCLCHLIDSAALILFSYISLFSCFLSYTHSPFFFAPHHLFFPRFWMCTTFHEALNKSLFQAHQWTSMETINLWNNSFLSEVCINFCGLTYALETKSPLRILNNAECGWKIQENPLLQ